MPARTLVGDCRALVMSSVAATAVLCSVPLPAYAAPALDATRLEQAPGSPPAGREFIVKYSHIFDVFN